MSFFALPLLTAYFSWKRQIDAVTLRWLGGAFVVAAVIANVYPFAPGGNTEILAALHLPIALWLAVGIAYAGKRWSEVSGRMDFVQFSGELFIYYVLIALGGGVLTGFMAMIFNVIGIDIEPLFESWLLPYAAMGAVLIASWLVEAEQSVIENMAPVLTRLFTPMFAVMIITFLGLLPSSGGKLTTCRSMLDGQRSWSSCFRRCSASFKQAVLWLPRRRPEVNSTEPA